MHHVIALPTYIIFSQFIIKSHVYGDIACNIMVMNLPLTYDLYIIHDDRWMWEQQNVK